MAYATEITVILKDADRTLKRKFLEYTPFQVNAEDPKLREYVEITKKDFSGNPEDVIIKTSTAL